MKEVVYRLTLDIGNSKSIMKSISYRSEDLIEVLSKFPIGLTQLLKEMHEEEMMELISEKNHEGYEDDIPF